MNESDTRPADLSTLLRVELPEAQREALESARSAALGGKAWQVRKRLELQKIFALEQLADRLTVRAADVTTDLRVLLSLEGPVPCWQEGGRDISVADRAELALHYPEAILRGPLPGYAIVEIVRPRNVFHANVSPPQPGLPQRLCLGANVPRGFPLVEAVLATHAAFSLQSLAIDEADPAGLMNGEAARWWQDNLDRIPLSTAPFLAPCSARFGGQSVPAANSKGRSR